MPDAAHRYGHLFTGIIFECGTLINGQYPRFSLHRCKACLYTHVFPSVHILFIFFSIPKSGASLPPFLLFHSFFIPELQQFQGTSRHSETDWQISLSFSEHFIRQRYPYFSIESPETQAYSSHINPMACDSILHILFCTF